jgi:hypothetical protein
LQKFIFVGNDLFSTMVNPGLVLLFLYEALKHSGIIAHYY